MYWYLFIILKNYSLSVTHFYWRCNFFSICMLFIEYQALTYITWAQLTCLQEESAYM